MPHSTCFYYSFVDESPFAGFTRSSNLTYCKMSGIDGLVNEVSSLLASRLAIRAGDAAFFGGPATASNASTSQTGGKLSAAIGNARAVVDGALQGSAAPTKALLDDIKTIKDGQQKILSELALIRKLLESGTTAAGAAKVVATGKAPAAAASPKKEAEEEAADDDFDLFGSDEEDDEEKKRITEERLKAYAEKKSKKPGPIAKSSVILDVKPWDDETDLKEMESLVRGIEMDGLVWGGAKFLPIGYGIQKLQIICVIEDDKVSVDDLTEKITGDFESHVQSVDIAAFNKI